jgi:biotin/methionine sulfoxide reductase
MRYPDIKLVYWAGGNPFHHHQDINRLRRAFNVPQTIVVHESAWTPMAKFSDIVLPATMTLERDDIGAAGTDPRLIAMRRRWSRRRSPRRFRYFAALSRRWASNRPFTEGVTAGNGWRILRADAARAGRCRLGCAGFDEFWRRGELALPSAPDDGGFLRAFRNDPVKNKLPTPSGRIEIHSNTIAGFGYDDCLAHPAWLPSTELPDSRHPLTLIANQPATRLHSQLDFGAYSQSKKIAGREPVRLNPVDAARRGIADGAIVRLFNDRGACLAAATVTDDVMPGVLQLSTGAWYDPQGGSEEHPLCVHGNPNVLTRDIGTSRLAQGCCGQVTVVECEKYEGELPSIRAFDPPDQG